MKRFLKSSLSIFLAITIIFSSAYVGLNEIDFSGLLAVKAEAASEDDLIFTLNGDKKSYYVSYCDEFAEGELVICDTYAGLPVTGIGDSAFSGRSKLESVIIPDSVTSIGEYAFYNCKGLTSITIPDSVTSIDDSAFYNCSKLNSITIPDSVTSIGKYAFYNCTSLTAITIPDSVTSIGDDAFYDTGYSNDDSNWVYYDDDGNWEWDALYIGNHLIGAKVTVSGEYKIKEGTKTISESAFYDCRYLTSITIPDSVTSIGDEAFYNCKSLTSITIPDSVTSIGEDAFYGTAYYNDGSNWVDRVLYIGNHLIKARNTISEEYKIKEGAKTIADGAFYMCSNLNSITIPDSVTSIGSDAFSCCKSLTSITIPDGVTSIADRTFDWCESLRTVTISDSVASITSIGSDAFSCCESLTSITIPSSVTSIGYNAFQGCESLGAVYITDLAKWCEIDFSIQWKYDDYVSYESNPLYWADTLCLNGAAVENVVIPDGVTQIPYACFSCESIESIVIPKSVTSIGDYAFGSCEYIFYLGTEEDWSFIDIGYTPRQYIHFGSSNHTASGWIIDDNATVFYPGYKYKKCTQCGMVLETAEIPQLKCAKPTLKSIENTAYGVKIKWGSVSGADKYYVYRKTSSGSYSRIGSTTNTYYTDKTAKSGKKYYYIVKAINEVGGSDSSSSKSIYYLADTTLKTPSSTKSGIVLKWSKVTGAEGYMVYRKTGSGSYSKIATVKGNTKITYTDKSAKKGKKYTYKIKAYKSKTYSAYSNTKTITDKY